MPELPDLHVFAENLTKLTADKRIVSADIFSVRNVSAGIETLRSDWLDTCIAEIKRSGKELYFHSASEKVFSVHLMLSGGFDVCTTAEAEAIPFKIMSMGFDDGTTLVISDYQSLCKVTLNPAEPLAPDALSDAFTLERFLRSAARSKRKNIKAFIIDQSVVRGIGNAYADEILWTAGISPESTTGSIPEEKMAELYTAVGTVLTDAIVNIKRLSHDIIKGEERSFLKVHNSHKKRTDDGEPIIVRRIASKITYFTAAQTLYK